MLVLAETPSKLAVMVVVPAATVVARPLLVIVATEGSEELQAAWEVTSSVLPPENEPVATNCWVVPGGKTKLVGAIVRVFGGSGPHPDAKNAITIVAETNLAIFMNTSLGTAALPLF